MTSGFRLGDNFKLTMKEDGKLAIEKDEARIKAKKPVNARFAKKKTRFAKPGERV